MAAGSISIYRCRYGEISSQKIISEPLRSLTAVVGQLLQEVGELRHENAELRQQVRELRGDVGYWKSRHADAVERNTKLKAELDEAKIQEKGVRNLFRCKKKVPDTFFADNPTADIAYVTRAA
ncbi:hypothetical protein OAS39_10810 [Pirellulales bacterium]|nr:hypothetical protein [Pirellulales bacterium]